MANHPKIAMNTAARLMVVACIMGACKSVPRDNCGRPLAPPTSSEASTREVRFIANVEPNSFVGIVLDSVTKRPLPNVSVDFPELRTNALSDSLGVFRFRDLPPGWHQLRILRVGFAPQHDSIQVSSRSGTAAVYDLPRQAVECTFINSGGPRH
jgi:hypothetical protein